MTAKTIPWRFLFLMVLVGLNLRPALSSLAPVLNRVQQDTALTPLSIGALTTLPVLCLGLFAPAAPRLSRQFGPERALALSLVVIAAGLLLRWLASPWALFTGTFLVGAGIGVGGALLPALVKRELPRGADLMTGVYTMALCLGGALGAGLSIPLSDWLGGWPPGLAAWSLLAIVALVAWELGMPRTPATPHAPGQTGTGATRGILRQPLTWQIMVFMGAQSSLAYIVFGWLPTLLVKRGYDEAEAGWLMGMSVLVQLISALAAPWLARLGRDQRPALLLGLSFSTIGLCLLLLAGPFWKLPGVVMLGLGQGGSFSLALALIVLRSADSRLAGRLSGLAQGGGYALASLGPFSVGIMLQLDVGIPWITAALVGIATLAAACSWFAGRNRQLAFDEEGRLITR
ncbi:MFS transporter [Halomonas binhaiensis]|uniref:MFS transporter n=1 Tax=Halomonas binhaiensis TaxID=2562282 RepID=A0A856QVS4_9GAMM|nr:MFS transporter [Halomonas binhaiensis]QEM84031.2 MFS transporter [Halomonas binhaiensis]